jgi:Protein of unknown function (DUF3293)
MNQFSDAEKSRATEKLRAHAEARDRTKIELINVAHEADPTGKWPPEPSRLVLGIDLDTAGSLGRQFRQNGIVWVSANAVPTLVLLR